MIVHDWSKTQIGVFHDFHQRLNMAIRNTLNERGLSTGY